MVKVFVVYDTKYGNTKLVAEKIVEGMKEVGGIEATISDVEDACMHACMHSHVETRISQYRALENGKAPELAKKLVVGKIEGQNELLKKYGLKRIDFSVMRTIKNLNLECMHATFESFLPLVLLVHV